MIEQNKIKHPLIKVFTVSFFLFLISISPVLIASKGIYLWTGDYNVQTIVFTERIHRLLHSEQGIPIFDWSSLLGIDFLTAYSDHIFSPFDWLLYILPYKIVPYAHSVVMAIKIGCAAVTAYIYCRQYVKTDLGAYICGLLYAFSGFQLFNLVFHFSDRYLMFPLLLYAFDQLVINKKPFLFAAILALNNIMSCVFCWTMCVCIAIYYIVRTVAGSYPKLDIKLFFRLAIECLCGVCAGMFTMLPSILKLSGNSRAKDSIFGHSLIAYESTGVLLKIIQSMFFPPELCRHGWYFKDDLQLTLSPPVLFIPLFTVVGVIYIWRKNKREWYSILLTVCAIIASVPLFNSFFSAFNSNYYSRWFFMPVLIMVMMTGMYIDNIHEKDSIFEIKICAIVTGFWIVYGIYSVFFQKPVNQGDSQYWLLSMMLSVFGLITLYLFHFPSPKLTIISVKNIKQIACSFCLISFLNCSFVIFEKNYGDFISNEVSSIWNDFCPINIHDEEFFRTSSCLIYAHNKALEWDIPTIAFFNSMIDGNTVEFFNSYGGNCTQSNKMTKDDFAVCSFLSVKYDLYFNKLLTGGVEPEPDDLKSNIKMTGFEQGQVFNRYILYENKYYIPMGYTFDFYLPIRDMIDTEDLTADMDIYLVPGEKDSDTSSMSDEEKIAKQKLLLKAIWLTDEQIDKYNGFLSELPQELQDDTSDETYFQDCKDRAATACYEFITNNRGFTAKTHLPKENLVFFSVPYNKGFTAYVDGQETEIERVFNGLSAVYVPQGDHSIEFVYETPGFKTGCIISIISVVVLLVYSALDIFIKKKYNKYK